MGLIADITTPLSFLLAAPLTERLMPAVFEHTSAASIWGASDSGVMGAIFTVMGAFVMVGFVAAWAVRDIRTVETRRRERSRRRRGEDDDGGDDEGAGDNDESEAG